MTQVLLVIDLQRDFIDRTSPLCVAGGAACLPRVQAAVYHARSTGIPVIWVLREHDPSGERPAAAAPAGGPLHQAPPHPPPPTGVDVELFRRHLYAGPDPGPVTRGSPGAALAIAAAPGELILVKTRFSAFFATPLDLILRRLGAERVVIAGVQTPNCIRSTAFDAVALDYPRVTVLAEATAAATQAVHDANLSDMRAVGIDTPSVAAWAAGGA